MDAHEIVRREIEIIADEARGIMSDVWREWADGRIKKHDKDLYEGNGKPAMTVRMDRVERFCEAATNRMTAVIILLLGAIATGIVDAVVRSHR